MDTAAAIDRVMRHPVSLEFDVLATGLMQAQQRGQPEEVNRQN